MIKKMRRFGFALINTLITQKNYKYNGSDIRKIIAKKDDCQFHISSNITIILNTEAGKKEYFRIISKHEPLKKRLFSGVDRYFDIILNDDNSTLWKNLITSDLHIKENMRKLLNISKIWDDNLKAFKTNAYRNFGEVGLPSLYNTGFDEHLCMFLKYMRGEISTCKNNRFCKKGQHETFAANRQLATRALAKCLGIPEIIPDVNYCELTIDGHTLFGTIMESAGGTDGNDIFNNERIIYEKEFFKELGNLEFFDSLCLQPDHRKDNYSIKLEGRHAKGICAFDNDCSRTFWVSPKLLKKTYAGCNSVVKKEGKFLFIARPYIDTTFYNNILTITKKELRNSLGYYLNKIQLFSLWKRIQKFKKAMVFTSSKENNFLLDFDSISYISFDKETNTLNIDDYTYDMKRYGMTYLTYNQTVDEHLAYLKSLEKR